MDRPTDEEMKAASAAINALDRLLKVLDKRDLLNGENPFHDLRMALITDARILQRHLVNHNIYGHAEDSIITSCD